MELTRRAGFYATVVAVVYLHAIPAFAFMPTPGDTIQEDIKREFSGGITSYTIPLPGAKQPTPPATPPTCETTLQQEQAAGQIPNSESCYCQVGATTPTCVPYSSNACQFILPAEESRLGPNAQYYDCTCPSGASTPSCTSYYQLCEAALPSYQNNTNQCSCSSSATDAVPECTSDYAICETNAAQYENGNTTCYCSTTNTQPTCCTSTVETTSYTVPGITAGAVANTGVGTIYCANSADALQYNAGGPTCPADSGITVCAYGICRNWSAINDTVAGQSNSFDKGNPSVTYPPTGNYWDWGYCDGPYQAGSCSGAGEWFSIFEGPSTSFTGSEFILSNTTYTKYSTQTVQSCVLK